MTNTAIDNLKSRLVRVRWPDEAPEAPWSFGTSLGFVREMIDYWSKGFDWRKTEAGLNAWPQYTTRIDGIAVHFLHVPGKGPAPKPLLLSHGWPGSILEFMKLIPLLTDLAEHGGAAAAVPGVTAFAPAQAQSWPTQPGFRGAEPQATAQSAHGQKTARRA